MNQTHSVRYNPQAVPNEDTTPMPIVLRAIVLRRGETVTQVAKLLGITRPALSKVLNGKADLSMDLAIKIEYVFQYSALQLLYRQVRLKYHSRFIDVAKILNVPII